MVRGNQRDEEGLEKGKKNSRMVGERGVTTRVTVGEIR